MKADFHMYLEQAFSQQRMFHALFGVLYNVLIAITVKKNLLH